MNGEVPMLAGHSECSGCSACSRVCPSLALVMREDEEGFLHPRIDADRCLHCGRCGQACPVLEKSVPSITDPAVFAVKAKDDALRSVSTSGGVFSLLAERVLCRGGSVFGAVCEVPSGSVRFAEARNADELKSLRGSKYVQADVGDSYDKVLQRLDAGRDVLFCGTPCQIAGLRLYLGVAEKAGSRHGRLLLVELVCHAVPSPLAWRAYVRSLGGRVASVAFRSKRYGWKTYAMSVVSEQGRELCNHLKGYAYLWGFLSALYLRPSCHACHFRKGRAGADLTLGDFWGVNEKAPQMDDNRGTSLVIVRTEAGRNAFESILQDVDYCPADYNQALKGNPSLEKDVPPHPNRAMFFRAMADGDDFEKCVRKLLGMTFIGRLLKKIKNSIIPS